MTGVYHSSVGKGKRRTGKSGETSSELPASPPRATPSTCASPAPSCASTCDVSPMKGHGDRPQGLCGGWSCGYPTSAQHTLQLQTHRRKAGDQHEPRHPGQSGSRSPEPRLQKRLQFVTTVRLMVGLLSLEGAMNLSRLPLCLTSPRGLKGQSGAPSSC